MVLPELTRDPRALQAVEGRGTELDTRLDSAQWTAMSSQEGADKEGERDRGPWKDR